MEPDPWHPNGDCGHLGSLCTRQHSRFGGFYLVDESIYDDPHVLRRLLDRRPHADLGRPILGKHRIFADRLLDQGQCADPDDTRLFDMCNRDRIHRPSGNEIHLATAHFGEISSKVAQ